MLGCTADIGKVASLSSGSQGFSAGRSWLALGCGVSAGQIASNWMQDTIHRTGGNGLSSDELH